MKNHQENVKSEKDKHFVKVNKFRRGILTSFEMEDPIIESSRFLLGEIFKRNLSF